MKSVWDMVVPAVTERTEILPMDEKRIKAINAILQQFIEEQAAKKMPTPDASQYLPVRYN